MSTQDKVEINKLPTGVPGLDEIVGGGLPEFSFNIIAGAPGSGNHIGGYVRNDCDRRKRERQSAGVKWRRYIRRQRCYDTMNQSLASTTQVIATEVGWVNAKELPPRKPGTP